jgi:hypothetical protein
MEGKMITPFFRLCTVWKTSRLLYNKSKNRKGKPTNSKDKSILAVAALALALTLFEHRAMAQNITPPLNPGEKPTREKSVLEGKPDIHGGSSTGGDGTTPAAEMRQMREMIEKLESRVRQLEAEKAVIVSGQPGTPPAAPTTHDLAPTGAKGAAQSNSLTEADRGTLDFLRGTTINLGVDGYYGYNFNRPIGRINLLRAYDAQSNSFTLNQATIVLERAPDVEAGRRFGGRLDLMFGQATETGSANPGNEARPQVYRHIWQAYGTYVAPIGKGLTVDFGKFASSIGLEGNYTKDQINYSRSYLFNYLPYYHVGFRSNYAFNDKLNVTHYLVNGIGQSEDFNGFKSQALLLNFKPTKSVSWNVNYYTGLEGRDSNPVLNPGFAPLPTQPGLSTDVIGRAPRGRTHIVDAYASWNATEKLTLAGQFDYVINRSQTFSSPSRVTGGAAYARYQFTPKFALAGRAEYLSDRADRGGLFSGVTQALKETTATAEYKLDQGVLLRAEWRRDFSNQPFFLTNAPGALKKEQNTATLGLIWWFGRKEGGW